MTRQTYAFAKQVYASDWHSPPWIHPWLQDLDRKHPMTHAHNGQLLPFAATRLSPPAHAAEAVAHAKSATAEAVLYALSYASEAAAILRETATLADLPPTVADTLPRLAQTMEDAVQRMALATTQGRVR